MSDIDWLFCNTPQTTFSTKPGSGISAEKSSKSYGLKPGKLVLDLFSFYHKKGSIPAPATLPCSSQSSCAGGDPHSGVFGGTLVLLWQYNIKEGLVRFMLFIWAAIQ